VKVNRKRFLLVLVAVLAGFGAQQQTLRGLLAVDSEGHPVLKLPHGEAVRLEGDSPTRAVLADERLRGRELEVIGRKLAEGRFEVGPIHLKSMWVIENGKRLLITYWCPVCSIRTYSPGKCQCCQEETQLDLKEPAELP
jgi:hypothetical protein